MIGKFKVQSSKFKILILFLALAALFLLQPTTYNLQPVYAQACPIESLKPRVQEGLISTPNIDSSKVDGINKFTSNTGNCVIDLKAAFAPYKIPSFADLYSLYYTQSKDKTNPVDTSTATLTAIPSPSPRPVYSYTNPDGISVGALDRALTYTYSGQQAVIIFVEKNLSITGDITDNTATASGGGLVFVVGGNVNISSSANRIDAVIISQGTIYTAAQAGTTCSTSDVSQNLSGNPISTLTINGSLISLDASKPIQFCRKLAGVANNTTPAEVINNEVKYLVILRNLLSDTLQKWSEIQ